jgi:Flp pilus assembly protein protease CpaA
MGDPPPAMPRSVIESHRQVANAILLAGVLCLLNSLWFSGRSYVGARKRSLLVAALVLIPFIALFASLY